MQRWLLGLLGLFLPLWVGATVPNSRVTDHWLSSSTRVWLADADNDGVADEQDLCPNTPVGTPVNAYGCPQTLAACDYASSNITLTSSGSAVNGTVRYVLADSVGTILQINTEPTFTNLADSHTYMALAISYSGPVTGLTVGQSLGSVTASCFDWSDALPIKVCVPSTTSTDGDGDGVIDTKDRCPNTPAGTPVNSYGCPQNLANCDYTTPTFTLTKTGGSGDGTVRYVLADSAGTILQVSATASFGGLSGSHTYMVLAISHDGSASGLTVGQPLGSVTADCYDWSDAVMVKVCVATDSDGDGVTDELDRCPGTPVGTRVNTYGCPTSVASCDYTGSAVTLLSGSGSGGGSLRYVLTDSLGTILQVSPAPSFSGLVGRHTYMALALIYDGPVINLTAGQALSTVTASCYDWSDALVFSVCSAIDSDGDGITDEEDLCPNTPAGTPVNSYGCPTSLATCDYTTPSFTLTSSGGSGAGTLRYVLADSVGMIVQISPTPSFSGLSGSHTYMALALRFDSAATGLSVGQPLRGVKANCYNWSNAVAIKVCVAADSDGDGITDPYDLCPGTPAGTPVNAYGCPKSLVACDYTTPSVILTSTSPSTGGTVRYVLTDSLGTILQVNTAPTFSGLSGSHTYMALALTYADNAPIANLTPGQPLSAVTANCYDWSEAVVFKACVNPVLPCDHTVGEAISVPGSPGASLYVLVSPSGIITQISRNPSFPTTGLSAGTYKVYSLVCAADGSTGTIQVGRPWNTAQSDCQPLSAPVSVNLCAPCAAKCVPFVIALVRRR